jgi:hypothetical protein
MVAGGIYEHLVVEPSMKADLPESLALVQGTTGLRLERFWILVHGVATLALLAATVTNWGIASRRYYILWGDVIYLAMRAWSIVYFIPEMMHFQMASGASGSACSPLSGCSHETAASRELSSLDPAVQPASSNELPNAITERVLLWCSISWLRTVMILVQHVLLLLAIVRSRRSAGAPDDTAATAVDENGKSVAAMGLGASHRNEKSD